ncbi:MAG TPA: YncE family protein [Steroidobacteraceae bacterium]|nr:YncE family protein [Steroidobacteraceae bacterium]
MRPGMIVLALAAVACGLPVSGSAADPARPANLYHLSKAVPIGSPERWDYLLYERTAHRVYAAHGTSIDVLDGGTGAKLGEVPVPGANGVAVIPDRGKGYAGSRARQAVIVFDLKTFKILKTVPVGEDSDAVVYDPASKRVFVMEGDPHQAVAIDTDTDTVAGEIALSGQPEFAAADGSGHLFVNIADQKAIQRINTRTLQVEATWPIPDCESPHGMSIDPDSKRVFSTCINSKLLVVDAINGRIVATFPISKGSDASAFDSQRHRIFSSNGSGSLTVIRADGPDKYTLLGEEPTQLLARTMTVDPVSGRIFMLAGERIEVDPNATNPRQRYGVAPGSARLLMFDTVP